MSFDRCTSVATAHAAGPREARQRSLGAFFAPEAIAVIGASEREGTVGRALLENLYAYEGRVFPVNPKYARIRRIRAYARVADLPDRIDLAVIATPAGVVPQIIRECADAGVQAAIVHSAGFRECGAEGRELEQRMLLEARRTGMRILGPNCLGLMAPHHGLNATFAREMARPGNVAFISQSGALCTAVLDWSLRDNVGFSALVSVGSMIDVGWGELIAALGEDPHTRSIVMYMESVEDARAFLSAAREVAFTKPIIAIKAGRTNAAAKAAASHTGALTGSDAVIDAAFRRVGVLRVDSIEHVFDMTEVLAKQPRPSGRRLAIITNAGGPGALAVDRLVSGGGEVAALSPGTLSALNRILPAQWSHGNPVDVLGDADPDRYAKALEMIAEDSAADGVLVILTPQAMTDARGIAERVVAASRRVDGKPILASWMGAAAVQAGQTVLNRGGIPTFEYPDRAVEAFNAMWRYSANLSALYETPTLRHGTDMPAPNLHRVDSILRSARQRGRTLLTEHESKQVLAAYGIEVSETFVAETERAAVAIASRIGFPVVLKLHSETITHKRAAGGVCLNIKNAAGVQHAWAAIRDRLTQVHGRKSFCGVTVQRMMTHDGHELILGSSVDPQFGPVLMFGAGGRWVDVIDDRAIGLPPLTSTLARRLMERTRIYGALKAMSPEAAVDLAALEDTLVRFSQLVAEQRWIREMDINPLLVTDQQIIALDARIILHDPATPADALPTLAIRPYPQQFTRTAALPDGTTLLLRSIRPEDEPLMVQFHATLSDQSVYCRYFTAMSLQQRTRHARLARLCFIDYDREVALVALRNAGGPGAEILAVARLCKSQRNEAEFAIVVADTWQRRGLGTLLLRRLIDVGREEGLRRIHGQILGSNFAMRRLAERVGFKLETQRNETDVEASIVP